MLKKLLLIGAALLGAATAVSVDFCVGWNVQGCKDIAQPTIPLIHAGPVNVDCDNCYFETRGSLEFDIHPVERTLKIGIENMAVEFAGEVSAQALGSWSFDKSASPLLFQATLFDGHVGVVPVRIWVEVPLSLDFSGSFDGEADGNVGVTVKGNIGSWESVYDHGWKHIYPNPSWEIGHTLDAGVKASGDVSFTLNPQMNIYVDKIFEGGLNIQQKADLHVQISTEQPEEGDLECTLCQFVVTEVEHLLASNQTIQKIEDTLQTICSELSKSISPLCSSIVQEYLPQIISFLEEELTPQMVCEKLQLCATTLSPSIQTCATIRETLAIDWVGELKLDWFNYDKRFDHPLVDFQKTIPLGQCSAEAESPTPYMLADGLIGKVNGDPRSTWTATHNKFSWLSGAEQSRLVMAKIQEGVGHAPSNTTAENLPATFDSRQQWPTCIHPVRDQMQCGSCWAFSASEVSSDRLCISGGDNVVLSPEFILECDAKNMGCQGGYLNLVWDFLTSTGTVSDACQPYTSGGGNVGSCPSHCADGSPLKTYRAKSSSPVSSSQMQTEIMNNGPIQGAFSVYQDFMQYKSGVYVHKSGSLLGGHAIEIVGWTVVNNTPAWICKNSWNTDWGMGGYFMIKRGSNECGIESNAYTGSF